MQNGLPVYTPDINIVFSQTDPHLAPSGGILADTKLLQFKSHRFLKGRIIKVGGLSRTKG